MSALRWSLGGGWPDRPKWCRKKHAAEDHHRHIETHHRKCAGQRPGVGHSGTGDGLSSGSDRQTEHLPHRGFDGATEAQIDDLIDDIHSFSEIHEYFDQPVRMYSSGMQARLAFAVATAQRPEILIVDEALSVGDAYFQHKSFDRIRQFTRQGTTLLLVSHDKQAIQSICNRAILLDGGKVAMQGEPDAVMDYYNAMLAAHQTSRSAAILRTMRSYLARARPHSPASSLPSMAS